MTGSFGTDYNFLVNTAGLAVAESVSFSGTAASVQDRTNGLVLALGAEGSVLFKSHGLNAPMAANLRVSPDALTLTLPEGHAGGVVTVTAPGGWKLGPAQSQVAFEKAGTSDYRLTIPANVKAVVLTRGK